MALKSNFSTQLSKPERLKRIAASLGYRQTRGPDAGEGSIRQLLEAITAGEAVVIVKPEGVERAQQASALARKEAALQKLEASGVIKRPARPGKLSPFKPVKPINSIDVKGVAGEGESVSQMIIRERR